MTQGRKPGYTHSAETKNKISQSLSGRTKTLEHRDHISKSMASKSMVDPYARCFARYLEMKAEYPGHEGFFEKNKEELLYMLEDVKSEKELDHIRRYVENSSIHSSHPYQYSSSSCFAAEDTMIALIDAAACLRNRQ